ncbi:hypothetical protein CJF42_20705 [Pseudoalteromonas sp. NBT06-2]|uniref:hypothetical protein n=1 Tax=Pseudoalteromonas sp. NBT06-2 TaxID=2025950 RepID=UPI000BA6D1F9|nr:hypothetical protein [Pseudoalteromonas sp. NBT06-2]PAJ72537.1 hypothetical protein CJF42_20705 [Pseudoalteromonas sp. NBT06-2]
MKKTILLTSLLATLFSSSTLSSTTPKHFEYSWEGFSQPASAYTEAWYRRQYYTPSGNTGPSGGAEGSQWFVFFETSSGAAYYAGDSAYLQSATTTAIEVSFYYHMFGADIGTLALEIDAGNGWERVWEKSGQQHTSNGAAWTQASVNISQYPSSKKVRFVAVAAGGNRGDIAIDQIRFELKDNTSLIYTYDALGRLVCIKDKLNGNRNYEHDDAGNRATVALNNCAN